jgi:hypothetical protein
VFPAVVGEEGREKSLAEMLDGMKEVLHNLASLLLTDLTRRRGGKWFFNNLDNR